MEAVRPYMQPASTDHATNGCFPAAPVQIHGEG